MMSSKMVLFSCVAFFALSTALAIKGIPYSEERFYLYHNEEAGEFWFALGSTPAGTDMSTTSTNQEFALVSDGIGACHADAQFLIAADRSTATMTFKSTTGLPTGDYVYRCTETHGEKTLTFDLKSSNQSRIQLSEKCDNVKSLKLISVKMVRPFNCLMWLVVKGKQLNTRLESYSKFLPPTEIGLYATSHDSHPHEQFDRSPDGKRIIKVMEARYSFHDYFKGAGRPIPIIEIVSDKCRDFEFSFEINDVCKIQLEILPDQGFFVRINYLELHYHQNKWNFETYFDGDANGTQIVFTTNDVLIYIVHPHLQIHHLGSCDLGPKDLANDTFILQAWCDKSRDFFGCTTPALKFVEEEVYVKRPKKRPALTDFNWEKQKPIKRMKRPIYFADYWTQRDLEIILTIALVVIGANITVNICIILHRRIHEYYRNLPIDHWN